MCVLAPSMLRRPKCVPRRPSFFLLLPRRGPRPLPPALKGPARTVAVSQVSSDGAWAPVVLGSSFYPDPTPWPGAPPPRLARTILEGVQMNLGNVPEPTIKGPKHHPRLSESDRRGLVLGTFGSAVVAGSVDFPQVGTAGGPAGQHLFEPRAASCREGRDKKCWPNFLSRLDEDRA